MTDNQLTPAEVNAKLAEGDGWIQDDVGDWVKPGDNEPWYQHPPDYCGDWDLAGPLLEKMCEEMRKTDAADFPAEYQEGARYFNKLFGLILKMVWEFGMPEGVARAELARREGENESQ